MLVEATGLAELWVRPDELDSHPHLLNCSNGTVDLRTGELRPHDPADLLAMICPTPYDPAATCTKWIAAQRRIFAQCPAANITTAVAGASALNSTAATAIEPRRSNPQLPRCTRQRLQRHMMLRLTQHKALNNGNIEIA